MKKITLLICITLFSVSCKNAHLTSISNKVVLYKIAGGELNEVEKEYSVNDATKNYQDKAQHQELFNFIGKLIPQDYRKKLNQFLIFNGEKMGSDGFMTETNRNPSEWMLAIAINYAYEGGLNNNGVIAHTVVHEFAHYISLNETQLSSDISKGSCNNYYTDGACLNKDSYLNQFYQKFWADIYEEHQKAAKNKTTSEFHDKYTDRFISSYSSFDPLEDFAEVFSFFVQWEKPTNADTIVNQKLLFMYQYKELTDLRNTIRKNITKNNIKFPAKGFYDKKQ